MPIAAATITRYADVPVRDWPRSPYLIQGAVFVRHPITRAGYLIVAQAQETGPGDVEVMHYHRHRVTGSTIKYLDTMTCRSNVHGQTLHARISRLGNLWLWIPWGRASAAGKVSADHPVRLRYEPGKTRTRTPGKWFTILTQLPKGAQPVPSPSGYVGVRQPGDVERYDLHHEGRLLARGASVVRRAYRRKSGPGPYQGSTMTSSRVFVVSGSSNRQQVIYEHGYAGSAKAPATAISRLDVSSVGDKAEARTDEAQSVLMVDGVLALFKRYGPDRKSRTAVMWGLRW